MIHDFRADRGGQECFDTLLQWYNLEKEFGPDYLKYEPYLRFIILKDNTLLLKKKNDIILPLNINVSFPLTLLPPGVSVAQIIDE